ncbi:hypothetical protein LAZ67_14003224 [Cordylochernes scorpioides]|uniref:Uncharacterized protein n=1 Tax=Cordylochernes scorpioides TaxID=51811 RepID=A0ABY6L9E5_9ARAC|nr:hypothetical protein LAZ67_14003224 [Cordylochernes scorpioides]
MLALTQLERPKRCWKTSNEKFSHIHLILRILPQATSIFFQHSSCTLEASTLRMMTKCRRRRTTGYEDRTRLGTTVVSKNCYNGTKNVWTEMMARMGKEANFEVFYQFQMRGYEIELVAEDFGDN